MLSWRSSQSHLAVDEAPGRATGVQISHSAQARSIATKRSANAKLLPKPAWLSGRASHW
jgi:hypothetical protein